jgi:hypothetical protein
MDHRPPPHDVTNKPTANACGGRKRPRVDSISGPRVVEGEGPCHDHGILILDYMDWLLVVIDIYKNCSNFCRWSCA